MLHTELKKKKKTVTAIKTIWYGELRNTVTDDGRWKKKWVEKDREQSRGHCFGGRMRGGLDDAPFMTKPNLAELEGRGQTIRLGVRCCH